MPADTIVTDFVCLTKHDQEWSVARLIVLTFFHGRGDCSPHNIDEKSFSGGEDMFKAMY